MAPGMRQVNSTPGVVVAVAPVEPFPFIQSRFQKKEIACLWWIKRKAGAFSAPAFQL